MTNLGQNPEMVRMSHLIKELLSVVDAYMKATGYKEGTVGTHAFNEGKSIAKLRAGGDIGTQRYELVMQWFSDNWPPQTAWPEGVGRPPQKNKPVAEFTPIFYRRARKKG